MDDRARHDLLRNESIVLFPNPQDALPLIRGTDVAMYEKLAGGMASGRSLRDAQRGIARSHGFASWQKLIAHLKGLQDPASRVARFERAADAIVNGDVKTLRALLRDDPKLARARSTRAHHATLLHYTSANGVENWRQRTPKNIAKIAGTLLRAGAGIDAEADVYGGGATTLGLAATSVHPERAGVQAELLQTLLDHGASLDQPNAAGNGHRIVTGCLANGRPEAAAFLVDRGAPLDLESAAGVGRLDAVKKLIRGATVRQKNAALLWSCAYGHDEAVSYLLRNGAKLKARTPDRQTPLHMAASGAHLSTIKLLLKKKAPLEVKNSYGGTVLGQTLWSAANGGDPSLYRKVVKTLIDAGAKVARRHTPVDKQIDRMLTRHGCRVEPLQATDSSDSSVPA